MTAISYGYLTTPYLMGPYLGGYIHEHTGEQVDMKISTSETLRNQVDQKIFSLREIHSQVTQIIYKLDELNSQVDMKLLTEYVLNNQVELVPFVTGKILNQSEQKIYDGNDLFNQVVQNIKDSRRYLHAQTDQEIIDALPCNYEVKIAPLQHLTAEMYLTRPYLTESYLAGGFYALQRSQVELKLYHPSTIHSQVGQTISDEAAPISNQVLQKIYHEYDLLSQVLQKLYHPKYLGSQVNQVIEEVENLKNQVEQVIYDDYKLHSQASLIKAQQTLEQVNLVIYNITQLRILQNFASRGTPALGGNNWTSNVALRAGDYGTSNLNTDVIEQRCETAAMPAQWELICDTGIPQGAFVDTLCILDHNFTKSATITFQGSTDPLFGTVGFNVVVTAELINSYWIAPELPTQSFRYWRLIIADSSNTDSTLRIGAVIFGTCQLMSVAECYENPVNFGFTHYKDTVETEGYRTVSNDRALRKKLTLSFRDLKYDGGNYKMLREYMLANKTDLACVIIPRPTKPSAFAVFSKLTAMPIEEHNAISDIEHYVSFTLDWDESI